MADGGEACGAEAVVKEHAAESANRLRMQSVVFEGLRPIQRQFYPPDAVAAARTAWQNRQTTPVRIKFPEEAIYLSAVAHDPIEEERFVGAKLCGGEIEIRQFLFAGSFGRGWKAVYTPKGSTASTNVFIKTLGVVTWMQSGFGSRKTWRRVKSTSESNALKEAEIYMHEWFTSATESPCVATARLCYSDCVNEKTGFSGKVWFICGELCSGGELFCYLPRKKEGSPPVVPFEERFARRLFGQLAHGACQMKHCAEGEATPGPKDEHPAAAEQRRRRFNHGCFHRDLKLENVVISDDFDVMIMDYGDLYFTKDEAREARESEDAGSLPLRSIHHFEWVKRGRPKGHTYDPAARDVWSLGVTLFLLVGADQTFRAQNRALPTSQKSPGMAIFERFMQGGIDGHRGGMYPTGPGGTSVADRDGGVSGACGMHAPEGGVPKNTRLWKLFPNLDPDASPPGRLSHELKDLLNRIFDPDDTKRIDIEDILEHPWLQSHQAAGLSCPPSAVETDAQRSSYYAEMASRFLDPTFHMFDAFKLKNSTPVESLPAVSKAEAHEAVRRYIQHNTEQAELESGSSSLMRRFRSFFVEDKTPPPPPVPPKSDESRHSSSESTRTASSEIPPTPNPGTPLAVAMLCNPFSSDPTDFGADGGGADEGGAPPPRMLVDETELSSTIDIFRSSSFESLSEAVAGLAAGSAVIFRVQVTDVSLQLQWVRSEDSSATFGEWCNFCSSMSEFVDEVIAERAGGD